MFTMEPFFRDLRHALRTFRQSPVFTITALTALALGIGGTTAIFSVVNAVFLRPLPYPDPDRIVVLASVQNGGGAAALAPTQFNICRQRMAGFQDLSAYRFAKMNLTGTDRPEQIQSAHVSADYFRLFGLQFIRGRAFTAEEDRPKGGNVVVVSDRLWKRVFEGNPEAVGKTLFLDGKSYTLVGIVRIGGESEPPAAYDASSARDPIDVWVPFQIDPESRDGNDYFSAAARLGPGVTLAAGAAQVRLANQEFQNRYAKQRLPSERALIIRPMNEALSDPERQPLMILFGAVTFLWLIACANVANLSLARSATRKREIGIRVALGAGRSRVIRQLLLESLALSLTGGALGVILSLAAIRTLLVLNAVYIPRVGDQGAALTVDWRVLSFTLVSSITTAVLCGLLPALRASCADLSSVLKENSRQSGVGFRLTRLRSLLVISEAGFAVILFIAAALLIRSFVALRTVNPGFDSDRILSLRMSLSNGRFQETSGLSQLVRDGVQRVNALPGVAAAAAACCLPADNGMTAGFKIAGRGLHGTVMLTTASPGYFDVLKIPLLRGRAFTESDGAGANPVVIISQKMARRFWPVGDPLLDSLQFPDIPEHAWQIAGIAADVHSAGIGRNPPSLVYFPIAQMPEDLTKYVVRDPIVWMVRTRVEPHTLSRQIQDELRQASGGLPTSGIRSLDEELVQSISGHQFKMLLMTIFGCTALLLTGIGIYGLMAYSVEQRTLEIGVRLALGARADDVRNLVVFEGMRVALAGVSIGLAGAFGLTRVIKGFLFGVTPRDPFVFIIVPIVLSSIALAAVWLPALRASRVDPVRALRSE